jgi:nitroreductase
LIRKILEAGVAAPSGGNMQRWRFLVIRDPKVKQTVGAYYKRTWDEVVAPRYRGGEPAPGTSRERFARMLGAAQYLADHIHEAPVWIVPCLEGANPTRTSGSSIYPAVQNMLLAARALGLGATLTTLYLNFEKEVEAALGLPPDVHSYALLPIGYPMGRFGPVRRVPIADSFMKTSGVSLTRREAGRVARRWPAYPRGRPDRRHAGADCQGSTRRS